MNILLEMIAIQVSLVPMQACVQEPGNEATFKSEILDSKDYTSLIPRLANEIWV